MWCWELLVYPVTNSPDLQEDFTYQCLPAVPHTQHRLSGSHMPLEEVSYTTAVIHTLRKCHKHADPEWDSSQFLNGMFSLFWPCCWCLYKEQTCTSHSLKSDVEVAFDNLILVEMACKSSSVTKSILLSRRMSANATCRKASFPMISGLFSSSCCMEIDQVYIKTKDPGLRDPEYSTITTKYCGSLNCIAVIPDPSL